LVFSAVSLGSAASLARRGEYRDAQGLSFPRIRSDSRRDAAMPGAIPHPPNPVATRVRRLSQEIGPINGTLSAEYQS
jgi:hypothetical protein